MAKTGVKAKVSLGHSPRKLSALTSHSDVLMLIFFAVSSFRLLFLFCEMCAGLFQAGGYRFAFVAGCAQYFIGDLGRLFPDLLRLIL